MNDTRQSWKLISSHGLVLAYVDRHPEATLRQIAQDVGLTERRVMELLVDLRKAGLISTRRSGRRNSYQVHSEQKLVHPDLPVTVQAFLKLAKQNLSDAA
jgi:DNA-binding MarR family transcriptional regulator